MAEGDLADIADDALKYDTYEAVSSCLCSVAQPYAPAPLAQHGGRWYGVVFVDKRVTMDEVELPSF